ncbi:MAG: hypothetical protein JO266_17105 [Acidobacteria bacterium]|nr:hypothetical protein [Acidobacteriota bacterium]MBV8893658.1 hypothetical protein [Acidobacteriota bacterium]MBV9482359.1 hypothetical protein [Acidobacteriota bacterium]
MKRSAAILLSGIGVSGLLYLLLRRRPHAARETQIDRTSQDFEYQDLSPADLDSQNLTDINEADAARLKELGLDQQSLERLIENRPYRNKLDLVSRMILTEEMYATVKEKIAVSRGRQPVKVA